MAEPAKIEALLRDGAQRLRARYATPLLKALREAVGLRDLSTQATAAAERESRRAAPTFKQYREADGKFYFKLVDGDRVLLQSEGFDSARDAGQLVARAKQDAGRTLDAQAGAVLNLFGLPLDTTSPVHWAPASALAIAGGWALLLVSIALAFIAQSSVAESLNRGAALDPRDAAASGIAGALSLWLTVLGLALVGVAVLLT